MLFIDFERPQRLRVRGEAELIDSGPLVESYPGAQYVVQLRDLKRLGKLPEICASNDDRCPPPTFRMKLAGPRSRSGNASM